MGEYAKKNRYAIMSVCGMGAFGAIGSAVPQVGFGESASREESGVGEGIGCDEIGSQEIGCEE